MPFPFCLNTDLNCFVIVFKDSKLYGKTVAVNSNIANTLHHSDIFFVQFSKINVHKTQILLPFYLLISLEALKRIPYRDIISSSGVFHTSTVM